MNYQVVCKRDAGVELEVQQWIENVLGEKFPRDRSYEDTLQVVRKTFQFSPEIG